MNFIYSLIIVLLVAVGIETSSEVLFDKRVTLEIPDGWAKLSSQEIEKKYLSSASNLPDHAYAHPEKEVSFAITHSQGLLPRSELKTYGDELAANMKESMGERFVRSKYTTINGNEFIILEFVSPTVVGGNNYNVLLVSTLENRALLFNYSCSVQEYKSWVKVSEEIINAIRIKGT